MPCCGQASSEYSKYQSIKQVPQGAVIYILTINPSLDYVPVRTYKSLVSNISYKSTSKDDVIEILEGDLSKMLGQQFAGTSIFVLQGVKEDVFVESQSVESYETQNENIEELLVESELGIPLEPKEEIVNEVRDDFTLISGIGDATQSLIFNSGIFTYEDLLNASVEQIEELKIKSSWVEQAKILIDKRDNEEV